MKVQDCLPKESEAIQNRISDVLAFARTHGKYPRFHHYKGGVYDMKNFGIDEPTLLLKVSYLEMGADPTDVPWIRFASNFFGQTVTDDGTPVERFTMLLH